jgi:hypothetical protein
MTQAGRYPRSGHRGPAGDLGAFVDWLDKFVFEIRALVSYPGNCRDEIKALQTPLTAATATYESIGRAALKDLFFFQNGPFDGWYSAGGDTRVRADGSNWE